MKGRDKDRKRDMTYFVNEFLNDIKTSMDMKYDQELADLIGYSKPMVSAIRNGRKTISEEKAIWLCQFTSFSEGQVLVGLAADNAKTEEAKKTWWKVLKHIKNDERLELKMNDLINPNIKSIVRGLAITAITISQSIDLIEKSGLSYVRIIKNYVKTLNQISDEKAQFITYAFVTAKKQGA